MEAFFDSYLRRITTLIMPFQAVGGSYSNIWSAGIPGSVDTEDVSSNLANLPIIPSRRG